MLFTRISLVTNNIWRLFMYLFAICVIFCFFDEVCSNLWPFFKIYFLLCVYFDCAGSSLLSMGFLWLWRVGLCPSCGCGGFSVHWLLLLQLMGLGRGLGRYGTQAWLPFDMWNPPGSGIEPMSPALAAGFLTTGPPRKSWSIFYIDCLLSRC